MERVGAWFWVEASKKEQLEWTWALRAVSDHAGKNKSADDVNDAYPDLYAPTPTYAANTLASAVGSSGGCPAMDLASRPA